jgi:hypothetical protein
MVAHALALRVQITLICVQIQLLHVLHIVHSLTKYPHMTLMRHLTMSET